jgi:hypothetical protein
MLFKKHLLHKVLDGSKTQTRRRVHKMRYRVGSIQPVKSAYYEKPKGHVQIKRRFEQRLADMTEEEARAEGYENLEAFRKEWPQITKRPLDLQETVTAYEIQKTEKVMRSKSTSRCRNPK